jgi:endo-1,4-beta-xylanase
VKGWDVANEALDEDGSLRKTPWLEIIGDDYLVKAYEFAHEADPNAELYYNDYFLENPIKRKGAIALLGKLKAAGIPIVGVGIQEHVTFTWPKLTDLDDAISDFGKLGLKVMITELDVDVLPASKKPGDADINRKEKADPKLDPYTKGFPDDMQEKLAKRYADLFGVYLKHRGTVTRVTFWGLDDGQSWLNGWPIKGRTEHPLLFDRAGHPKPAYHAVLNAPK